MSYLQGFIILFGILLLSIHKCQANEQIDAIFGYAPSETPLNVGIGFGVLEGMTFEGSVEINPHINLRLAHAQGVKYKKYDRYLDYDYRYYTNGGMTSLMLDYFPFKRGFFLSFGYVRNNFKIQGDSQIPEGSSYSFGGMELLGINLISLSATATEDITLDGKIRWKESGPRFSLGWFFDLSKNLNLKMEFGALFFGEPELYLVTSGEVNGENVNNIVEVNEEKEQQIKSFDKDASKYDILPVVHVGLNYRF